MNPKQRATLYSALQPYMKIEEIEQVLDTLATEQIATVGTTMVQLDMGQNNNFADATLRLSDVAGHDIIKIDLAPHLVVNGGAIHGPVTGANHGSITVNQYFETSPSAPPEHLDLDAETLIAMVAIVGKRASKESGVDSATEHEWEQFMDCLRAKASDNEKASTVLSTLINSQEVWSAVQAISANIDRKIIELALHLATVLQQKAPEQYNQVAEKIININTNNGPITM